MFAEPSESWTRSAFLDEEAVAAPHDDVAPSRWSKPWTGKAFRRVRHSRPAGAPPTINGV